MAQYNITTFNTEYMALLDARIQLWTSNTNPYNMKCISTAFSTLTYDDIINEPPSYKAALLLYAFLLRKALINDESIRLQTLTRLALISLQDYDTVFSNVMLNYGVLSIHDMQTEVNKLLLFWEQLLRYPLLPDYYNDCFLCFFCFAELVYHPKPLQTFLLETQCDHYCLPIVDTENHVLPTYTDTMSYAHPTINTYNTANDNISLPANSTMTTWLQGHCGKADVIDEYTNADQLWKHKLINIPQTQTNLSFDDMLKVIKSQNSIAKTTAQINHLQKQKRIIKTSIDNITNLKYIHTEPMYQLHYILYHLHNKYTLIHTLCPLTIPICNSSLYYDCIDKLKTASLINHSQIINLFYTLYMPPLYVYDSRYSSITPRCNITALLYGTRRSPYVITPFRQALAKLNLNILCGIVFEDITWPTNTFNLQSTIIINLLRVLWSVVNIYAYCTTYNNGETPIYRADDIRHKSNKEAEGFYHMSGGRWIVKHFKCSYVITTNHTDIFTGLTYHLQLVNQYGGGFRMLCEK